MEDIRGKAGDDYDWPDDGYAVNPDSFMGLLRTRTGLDTFDLPTEAQWEWACRALTRGSYNVDGASMDQLGRYSGNGGSGSSSGDDTNNGTAAVGTYLPNVWGLYDMHGNVFEWCLDWKLDNPSYDKEGGTDPVGADSGTSRVNRGGFWNHTKSYCRSALRSSATGFRILRILP